MKMSKRVLAMLLVLVMCASVLAGCAGNQAAPATEPAQSNTPSNEVVADTPKEEPANDKPFAGEKIVLFSFAGWVDEGKEEILSARLEEDTGMTLDIIVVPWDERITKMAVMVAGGQQIDVTGKSTPADMSILCDAGALLPVNDYIRDSEVFSEENWNGWQYMDSMVYAEDGLWYGVPTRPVQGYIYTINQAWLDKLGLEVPKTTEELTAVLREFKKADLGGNGATIPIAHQFPNSDHIATFLGMWGIEGPFIQEDDSGKRYHPWLTEEGLAGLQWMQDMYKEGLLDPEFANENGTEIYNKVTSGLVGVFLDWPGSNRGYNQAAEQTGALVNMVPIAIPQALEGVDPVNCGNTIIMDNLVASSANPDAAWAFIEWLNTTEGTKDWTWTEGENYNVLENGEVEILATQLHSAGYDTWGCLNKVWLETGEVPAATDETIEGYEIFYDSWAFPAVLSGAGDAEEIALPLATQVICGQMSVEAFETEMRTQLLSAGLSDQ